MKKSIIVLSVSFLGILACLAFVDPNTLAPLGFLPIIGLVYLFSGSALLICMTLFFDSVEKRQRLFLAAILAFAPTILFSLMTLSTLAALDVVLAITLPSLAAWYGLRLQK